MIVTVAWNVLWPSRSGENVKHVIQGHCGHQRARISQQVPAQVEQSRFRSSWRAPRQSAGAQARDLSQASRQSGACRQLQPRLGTHGPCRAYRELQLRPGRHGRKFLELSQGQLSFLNPRGEAFECSLCINLVLPYRAVALGITLCWRAFFEVDVPFLESLWPCS